MKYSWLGVFFLFFTSCQEASYLNETPISMKAEYMRYACGDWNDDMQVQSVSDSAYSFLVGRDIDPIFLSGQNELGELFDKNEGYLKDIDWAKEDRTPGMIHGPGPGDNFGLGNM